MPITGMNTAYDSLNQNEQNVTPTGGWQGIEESKDELFSSPELGSGFGAPSPPPKPQP